MRRDHRGRFAAPTITAPLLFRKPKSQPHVRAEQTKRERQRAKVLAKADDLRAGR